MFNSKFKGFLYGAVAAATYGMNPLFALPLYRENIDTDSVLFYRYAFAMFILAIVLKCRGVSFDLNRKEFIGLVISGLLFSFSSLFLFLSYRHMPSGIASTILFIYPAMVALIMGIFFGEKIKFITFFSIILTLIGIALLYRSESGAPLSFIGVLFVIISALAYALYIVFTNQLGIKNMDSIKFTFYVLFFGLFVFAVRLNGGSDLAVIPSLNGWVNVLALAIFPTAVSLFCTLFAIRYVGPTVTAILGALEPATAVFFGVLLFKEPITLRILAGVILIIFAVTLIVISPKLSFRSEKKV